MQILYGGLREKPMSSGVSMSSKHMRCCLHNRTLIETEMFKWPRNVHACAAQAPTRPLLGSCTYSSSWRGRPHCHSNRGCGCSPSSSRRRMRLPVCTGSSQEVPAPPLLMRPRHGHHSNSNSSGNSCM